MIVNMMILKEQSKIGLKMSCFFRTRPGLTTTTPPLTVFDCAIYLASTVEEVLIEAPSAEFDGTGSASFNIAEHAIRRKGTVPRSKTQPAHRSWKRSPFELVVDVLDMHALQVLERLQE